jgi:hypothetical protein
MVSHSRPNDERDPSIPTRRPSIHVPFFISFGILCLCFFLVFLGALCVCLFVCFCLYFCIFPFTIPTTPPRCAKYDPNGQLGWIVNTMARNGHDTAVKVIAQGSWLYVMGHFYVGNNVHTYVNKLDQADGSKVSGWGMDWAGNCQDIGTQMMVDANNFVYVVGMTCSSFPNTFDANMNPIPGFMALGGDDGFMIILGPGAGSLLLNINFGTSSNDAANGITLDGMGGIYVSETHILPPPSHDIFMM